MFIKLTLEWSKKPVLVNTNSIATIYQDKSQGAKIYFIGDDKDNYMTVDESLDKIKELLND